MNAPTLIVAAVGVCVGIVASATCHPLRTPQQISQNSFPDLPAVASDDLRHGEGQDGYARGLQNEAAANREARQQFVSSRASTRRQSHPASNPGLMYLAAVPSTPPPTVLEKSVAETSVTTQATVKLWESIATGALGVLGKTAEAITNIVAGQATGNGAAQTSKSGQKKKTGQTRSGNDQRSPNHVESSDQGRTSGRVTL